MIALIVDSRCTQCERCVQMCPSNVLALRPGQPPHIARVDDCQTCFLCELYCRADAIYVDPDCDRPVPAEASAVEASGLLGQFRRDSGWDEWHGDLRYPNLHWHMDEVFQRGRELAEKGP